MLVTRGDQHLDLHACACCAGGSKEQVCAHAVRHGADIGSATDSRHLIVFAVLLSLQYPASIRMEPDDACAC